MVSSGRGPILNLSVLPLSTQGKKGIRRPRVVGPRLGKIMPIHRATKDGKQGWQWGTHGKVYKSRADAVKQAQAAHANGYKEPQMKSNATRKR